MKNCPITYPKDLAELTPWPHADNAKINMADDLFIKKIKVHGQVNPVRGFHG